MKYNLETLDKNAFCVIGYVTQAMRESGETKHDIYAYTMDALSSTWEHLWRISEEMIEKLNGKTEEKEYQLLDVM